MSCSSPVASAVGPRPSASPPHTAPRTWCCCFADTLVEDEDLYRFLDDAAAQLGVPVTVVADGRTPFQVFRDQRFLGNSRLAPCSIHLKVAPCRAWLRAHTDPADTILYVGLDRSEPQRAPAITRGWAPWTVRYPLFEPPYLTKQDMLDWCTRLGVTPPRLYALGLGHNNCGGACVRAGQRQWLHLLSVFPDRFDEAEQHEAQLRAELGDVAILRDRRGGVSRPLPLTELRGRHQTG